MPSSARVSSSPFNIFAYSLLRPLLSSIHRVFKFFLTRILFFKPSSVASFPQNPFTALHVSFGSPHILVIAANMSSTLKANFKRLPTVRFIMKNRNLPQKKQQIFKDRLQLHLRMHQFSMLCLLPAPTNNNILPSLLVLHHN